MPGKELVTETCVRQMAPGSELVLGPTKIATPAALDLAFQRGIRVRRGAAQVAERGGLWSKLKAADGTYVVTVRGGRATAVRVDGASPVTLGEE
jgi:hypothetical protein